MLWKASLSRSVTPFAAALQQQLQHRLFSMSAAAAAASGGPTTATPPANTARGATADLADVFIPEPVDEVSQRKVNIMDPIFQCVGSGSAVQSRVCSSSGGAGAQSLQTSAVQQHQPPCSACNAPSKHQQRASSPSVSLPSSCRDLGGNLRFSGQVSTAKCFENNPLVRKVCGSAQGSS